MTLNDRFEFISAFHSNMLRFPNRSCFFLYERLLERLNYVLWPLFFPLVTIYRLLNRHRQQLVAISGSVGKTTTTRAVYFFIHGFVPDWIHGGENSFCATGWNLLRQGYHSSRVVLEIGIGKAGQMQRYTRVFKPDLVIMTSITSDH